jgi:hypothetical protein
MDMQNSFFRWLRRNKLTTRFAALVALQKKSSYLVKTGWFGSFTRHIPIDASGTPSPWYTYAALDFLKGRVNRDLAAFEYGSGNSTIWWAEHVSRVVSCEHDKQWYLKLKSSLPGNVEYLQVDFVPSGEYSKLILHYKNEFDVIVIDGKDRVICAMNCLPALTGDGVIIWDNSDRLQDQVGYDWLVSNGFKRLDFFGLGPANAYGWCTSVFYRPNNCLGI